MSDGSGGDHEEAMDTSTSIDSTSSDQQLKDDNGMDNGEIITLPL